MKNLFSLLCLVVLLGVSSSVMGQTSTGFRPFVGETKTYQVNQVLTNTYTWTLTLSATDATTGDLLPAGTIASAPASYNGAGKNSIAITWVNPTVPTIYYLHVVESDGSCTNHKALAIQPANNFRLAISNINSDNSSTLASPFEECAPSVTVSSWNGTGTVDDLTEAQNFTYNYGTKVFYYKIVASGINFATTTWNAGFTVAETAGGTVTVEYVTGDEGISTPSWTTPIDGISGANIFTVPVNKKALFIRVTIANGTANETLANESITSTIDASSQENLGNQAAIITTATTVQTQLARPSTGPITPNP
ncbi:MAG: hypothetical protein Q8P34_15595 [Bacteroidota bacterium]|nr:hypothetical protein [Bacteroidota bacterium]